MSETLSQTQVKFHFGKPEQPATEKAKKAHPKKANKTKNKNKKNKDKPAKKRVIAKYASEAMKITKSFGQPSFYILPTQNLPPGLLGQLFTIPFGPKLQQRWLTSYIQRYADEKKQQAADKKKFKFQPPSTPPTYFSSMPPIQLVREHLEKARKVRAALSKLVHVWRVKHLKAVNTEDIVTMEVPLKPVHIVDWAQKTTTVFEANTLMRDITTCLLHHDGFFEEPKEPRNPLTNLPLTQSQILSVWMQITKSGIPTSSVFGQFRQARYSLQNFHLIYGTALRLHAFRDTMKNLLAYDSKECLFNFIDLASQVYRKKYSLTKLMRDLRSENPQLVCYFSKWRQRCMEHYEATLLYNNQPDTMKSIQKQVILKTRHLLENKEYFEVHIPVIQVSAENDDDADESEQESESETESEGEETTSPSIPPLIPVQQTILRATDTAEQLLLPFLSTLSTTDLSQLLFPLTLPTTALGGVATPPPPPIPALPLPESIPPLALAQAEQPQTPVRVLRVASAQQESQGEAMNLFLNMLLDMGETDVSDFLPS